MVYKRSMLILIIRRLGARLFSYHGKIMGDLVNSVVNTSLRGNRLLAKISDGGAKSNCSLTFKRVVRRTLRLHQYFDLLSMMPPHQQGITLYGQYLLVHQYAQVQPFPQVD